MIAQLPPYFQIDQMLQFPWLIKVDFCFWEYTFRVQQLFNKQELVSYRNLADHLILNAWIEHLPEDPLDPSLLKLMAGSINSFVNSLQYPTGTTILSCCKMQKLLNEWIASLGKVRTLQKKTLLTSYKKFKKTDAFIAFRNSYPKRYKPKT